MKKIILLAVFLVQNVGAVRDVSPIIHKKSTKVKKEYSHPAGSKKAAVSMKSIVEVSSTEQQLQYAQDKVNYAALMMSNAAKSFMSDEDYAVYLKEYMDAVTSYNELEKSL